MDDPHQPLILCMDDVNGEEVALRIEQTDDFQTFLSKAKTMLGFEVDINSITRNQQVSLNDNIYQFLVNAEQNLAPEPMPIQTYDQILEPNGSNDYYILDDGTQIRASQIHFDNEDPHVDLSAEKIPFVKYIDDGIECANDFEIENIADVETTKYNIVGSPVSHWSSEESSPKRSFVNTLPFKLVCNNTSAFDAQFTKYLENSTAKTYTTLNPVTNRNKSPRSLIRDNYKNYDDKFSKGDDFSEYTREEILNMFKDSPVTSLPYEGQNFNEKRKHIRKTDPSRAVHKNWNSKPVNYEDGILIGDVENQNCFICGKFVENNIEKLYLFDNEDQKLHRSSPQKKSSRQLKIICEHCLGKNFKPGRMKGPNQCLNSDEYLVIRNNQQYIFQKTNKIEFKTDFVDSETDLMKKKETSKRKEEKEKVEFVKVEIGSDGEIVTKPIDNDPRSPDDVVIVKDGDKDISSDSDVEIIEPPEIDDSAIDNLDDADEDVKEFLGEYQQDGNTVTELKCRFCEQVFDNLSAVVDHGDVHKHELEEDAVYPCPLCDYGYANSKWLKGHIKAAHEKPAVKVEKENNEVNNNNNDEPKSKTGSPIAKRTRSSSKKVGIDIEKESPEKPAEENAQIVTNAESTESTLILKTEVKQEAIHSSDDEIWIVQTGDDDATEQIENLLQAAKGCQKENVSGPKKSHKCFSCSRIFPTEETLSSHKCRSRRGRKRKSVSKDDNVVCMPSKEDFMKRAQRRPRTSNLADSDNELLVPRGRRKKNKEPTSDPQIVTCHNCNESFTSKVRLKFHMQFHSPSRQPSSDGRYACRSCAHARFNTETELFDHVHFQHDKQKRWQCPVARCGKTFYLRATLTKHSRTHTDTRRYVCVTCGKRFLDKQTLDEHGVTHLQIKPFQCHICLKQLTRRSRLRMHLRAHEEELTLARVLVCAVCSRAFSGPTDAQDHAAKSTECIEEFTKELKEEKDEIPAQLSPTSGLVREIAPKTESPKLKKQLPRQVSDSLAEPLLSSLGDEARGIIRVVEIEKAFRCEFCEDVFYLEDGLNSHRTIHKDVKNPFTCHICKVAFATYSRCTTHKTTHGFYKRPLADAKKNASKPSEPEAGPSATGILGYGGFPVVKHFLCEDCGRSYLHWTYLQVHRRMKHPNDNFLYKCNHCDITFPNSWSLAYHRKKIHGQAGQGDTNATSKIPREDYRIPCRDCDEILPNKTALYKHRKKEHSDISLRLNNKPTSSYSSSNPTSHPNPTASVASCARCGEGFETIEDLHQHGDIQCRRRTHTCPVCSHSFRSASVRDEHLRTHTGERPFPCDVCGLAFRRCCCHRTHTCPVCSHTFRSASVRDEHLRTHTGERPFPCDVCGLAFRRSAAMRQHRLSHSVRAWACARCPRRFRARADLRHHARAKHPASQAVIEIQGLNPSLDEIMQHLLSNNISPDKVIEITKMSFAKGTVSVAPTCARAVAMLGDVPRTKVAWNIPTFIDFQQPPRGPGITNIPQTPAIPQRDAEDPPQETPYPITINVTGGELTDMDVQMLLRDGVLVNGNQMVQLQLDDSMLLE